MKIKSILKRGNIRILIYLHKKNGKARYSELLKNVIIVRSTLTYTLTELEKEELIKREITTTKPIKVHYTLTEKGRKIAKLLTQINQILTETDP